MKVSAKGGPLGNWQVQLLILGAIWGHSFLFIKLADAAFSPAQVTLARLAIGTAVLVPFLLFRREKLPRSPRAWLLLGVAGILFNVVPYTLFAFAETHISSVLAGIWNATTPLLTLVVALALLPGERATRPSVVGLVLGLVGVLLILHPWQGLGGAQLIGNLACLLAAAFYAVAFVYTRRFLSDLPASAASLAAVQLLTGTLFLAVLTPFLGPLPHQFPLPAVLALVGLGALGTGLAYMLNMGIVRAAGPTAASTVTYVVPVFATVAGLLFLGERVGWWEPIGGAVVLVGLALTQGRLRWPGRQALPAGERRAA
ncbi:MAG: DMT family transporter [Candidatus Dormibacter sp.]|uniref:DMT family transporter n=1 Tax=Candidatus Dormibacter sp. TaxID=2973982 RepID=UPI003D9B74B6